MIVVAIGVLVLWVVGAVLAWTLCRAAALGDERDRELRRR